MKKLVLTKEFTFDSAHRLPCVPDGHKCNNLHGHTWKFLVGVSGELNTQRGWILDFGDLKRIVDPVLQQLDHHYLNDVPGLENPTSELMAYWLWDQIESKITAATDGKVHVAEITVFETPTSYATLKSE